MDTTAPQKAHDPRFQTGCVDDCIKAYSRLDTPLEIVLSKHPPIKAVGTPRLSCPSEARSSLIEYPRRRPLERFQEVVFCCVVLLGVGIWFSLSPISFAENG